ncbi:MAG TPA: selenide, water dikinase SelD [Caulobacteraceae bacterium]
MGPPAAVTRDLLLIGGGHAHAIALRRWGMAPLAGVRVSLVNPEPSVLYTGMLPGHVAGCYARDDLAIDLVKLARFAGARLVLDTVTGLDLAAGMATLAGRPPIAFDVASLDIGVTSQMGMPGADPVGTPAKPMAAFALAWESFIADVRAGRRPPHATVIGAGIGGIELSLAMAQRLLVESPERRAVSVTLVEREPRIALSASAAVRALLSASLERAGVRVITAERGEDWRHDAGFVAEAAGARPAPWLASTGVALADGFVRTDACLRSVSHANIFAVGDIGAIDGAPRAKAGVYAVRQGPALDFNLRAALTGGRLQPFRPQRDHLKLIGLGGADAVAEKWGLALQGRPLWAWKRLIDRRFMARFAALPAMAPPSPRSGPAALGLVELEAKDPLCGGCGSKVGAATLHAALARLSPPGRADVLRGAGDDAAVLAWGPRGAGGAQVITSDHFRAFTEDPYVFAQIVTEHAMGDVWAMGAAPQAALASIVLPPMSDAKQGDTLAEVLAAMQTALRAAGADLVGGHTSAGAELILGLTVTGLTDERPPIGLDGARAGDLLILTKPIGVGTVLAAEMRGLARGEWVAAALRQMTASSGAAAARLRDSATAMTDVTGFGMAGHLHAMAQASRVRAELWLDAVPWADGAVDLAAAGVSSSLYPQNARLPVAACEQIRGDPRFTLLFDPQTAGGLLAALPRAAAAAVVDAFRAAGQDAWVVGELLADDGGEARVTVRREAPGD